MDSIDSIILKSMLKVNPEIERDRAETISADLARSLKGKELVSSTDLKNVTQEHLQGMGLNDFQWPRLIDWWKAGSHLDSDQQPETSSTSHPKFFVAIPWDYVWQQDKFAKTEKGELAVALLKEKRRPSKAAELVLINAMVAAAKTAYPTCERKIMEHMAKQAVDKYPLSLSDSVGDTNLGYKRFMEHCKNQFDNYEPRPCVLRKKQKTVVIVNMPVKAVIGLTKESWHNTELPPGETEENQEAMRINLIEYSKRRKESDPEQIKENLMATYFTQRKDVLTQYKQIKDFQANKKRKRSEDAEPEKSDLINKWPYLFRPVGLVLHFNKLYNLDLDQCLDLYFTYNYTKMFEYLISTLGVEGNQVKVCVKKAIEKGNDTVHVRLLGLMMLLAKTFKESVNNFILNVEPTTKHEDVADLKELPTTPCIVACGKNTFGAKKFYVTMDKYCFMAARSFKDAFQAAYAVFFVFHLDFPRKFGLVCEFIQREILNINVQMGSKRAEANGAAPIPTRIVNLQRDCDQYHRVIDATKASLEDPTTETVEDALDD